MSATVAVPRSVVVWAGRHHRRTGRPHLYSGRPGDVRLDALGEGRYLLTLDPEHAEKLGILDETEGSVEERAAQALLGLAYAVVVALGGEPISFVCEGLEVGQVEVLESPFGTRAVRVCGPVSVTCLSWLLHEGRAGYYLSLPGLG